MKCVLDEDWYFTFNNKEYHTYEVERITTWGTPQSVSVIAQDEEDALARAENFYKEKWDDSFKIIRCKDIKARDLWDIIWKNSVESVVKFGAKEIKSFLMLLNDFWHKHKKVGKII